MKEDVKQYRFQRVLDLASKYKTNSHMELIESEYEEMMGGYKDLKKWKETQAVYDVPLI